MERNPFAMNPRTGSVMHFTYDPKKEENKEKPQGWEVPLFSNPNISREKEDILYHLGLSNKSHDLKKDFGDVKFVCMGGSAPRMESFANLLVERGLIELPVGVGLTPVGKTERYSMFKVGPVISVNHGMGMASMSILCHELHKLLYHAGATDVIFIRIGTSGGLGVPPGSVVVSTEAVNSYNFQPYFTLPVLSKLIEYKSTFDEELADAVIASAANLPHINVVKGKTMSTDDFYEGQGRVDGALCNYTVEEQQDWLRKVADAGVVNIEMEGLMFGAFCNRANIKAVLCNTTLLDRFHGDQITSTPKELEQMSLNAQEVALNFMWKRLGLL